MPSSHSPTTPPRATRLPPTSPASGSMSIRSGHQLVTPTGPAQRLLIAIGVACFLPVASDAFTGQDTVLETAVIYPQEDGCSQLYSPTVLQDAAQPGLFHMWCGG